MRNTRRTFLAGTAALAGAGALDAFVVEPRWLEITRHSVPVAGLSRALEGMTLAQITDAHLVRLGRVERAIIQTVRSENVKLVVMTGDIVDQSASLPLLAELVSGLRGAGAEVVATLGNWEHWAGFVAAGLASEYRRFGARLLVDSAVEIAGVTLAGTDDGYAGAPRWERTLGELASLGAAAPLVLATHSPAMFDAVPREAPRFDLGLAGHTHGGQLAIGGYKPLVPPGSGRFVAGWYETPHGRAYVSRGTGTSVVPARFMCRPELPLFRLQRA